MKRQYLRLGDGKGMYKEVIFYSQIGKMLTPVDCSKLCICNIIPRITLRKQYKKIRQKYYR